jgi:hypothetical protein
MKRFGMTVLMVVALAAPVSASDFNEAAKKIETHFGIRRLFPHLIGFGLFVAKPMLWGNGVSGLKVAIFEKANHTFTPSLSEMDQIMVSSLSSKWQPFIRMESRKNNESISIYADPRGKSMHMMMATMERSCIFLVQFKLDSKAFKKWADDPKQEAKNAAHGRPAS